MHLSSQTAWKALCPKSNPWMTLFRLNYHPRLQFTSYPHTSRLLPHYHLRRRTCSPTLSHCPKPPTVHKAPLYKTTLCTADRRGIVPSPYSPDQRCCPSYSALTLTSRSNVSGPPSWKCSWKTPQLRSQCPGGGFAWHLPRCFISRREKRAGTGVNRCTSSSYAYPGWESLLTQRCDRDPVETKMGSR